MADITLSEANQADVTIVTVGKRTKTGTGGETMDAGTVVYLDSATGRYKKAIKDASANSVVAGILLAPTTNGKHCILAYEDGTEVALGASITANVWYTVSGTAGKLHPSTDLTTGDYISWIGYVKGGNLILNIINTGTQSA